MQTEPRPRTRALLSVPRLGWNDAWGSIVNALGTHGIPIRYGTGAYFDHVMERMLEAAIGEGFDQVLTLDYDTLLHPRHVADLLALASRPEVDALAPMQAKRGGDELLAMRDPPPTADELAGMHKLDLFPIDGAHFGATIIKLDKLQRVPKPWFQHVPAPDGSWNDGHVPADINFWLKWKAAGNSLYLAPKVRVGHLQVVNTTPMPDGTFDLQFVQRFNREGFPAGTFDD